MLAVNAVLFSTRAENMVLVQSLLASAISENFVHLDALDVWIADAVDCVCLARIGAHISLCRR